MFTWKQLLKSSSIPPIRNHADINWIGEHLANRFPVEWLISGGKIPLLIQKIRNITIRNISTCESFKTIQLKVLLLLPEE